MTDYEKAEKIIGLLRLCVQLAIERDDRPYLQSYVENENCPEVLRHEAKQYLDSVAHTN